MMEWKKVEHGWLTSTPHGTDLCVTETPFGWAWCMRPRVLCPARSFEAAEHDAEEAARILYAYQERMSDAAHEAFSAELEQEVEDLEKEIDDE